MHPRISGVTGLSRLLWRFGPDPSCRAREYLFEWVPRELFSSTFSVQIQNISVAHLFCSTFGPQIQIRGGRGRKRAKRRPLFAGDLTPSAGPRPKAKKWGRKKSDFVCLFYLPDRAKRRNVLKERESERKKERKRKRERKRKKESP